MTEDELTRASLTYGHLVLRRCRRLLRDCASAEDAAQETFLRLWRHGDAFALTDSKVARLPSRTTVGELSDGARLALPPGKFLAVLRDGSARAVSEVDLTWCGSRVLARGDFRPVSRRRRARRHPGRPPARRRAPIRNA